MRGGVMDAAIAAAVVRSWDRARLKASYDFGRRRRVPSGDDLRDECTLPRGGWDVYAMYRQWGSGSAAAASSDTISELSMLVLVMLL